MQSHFRNLQSFAAMDKSWLHRRDSWALMPRPGITDGDELRHRRKSNCVNKHLHKIFRGGVWTERKLIDRLHDVSVFRIHPARNLKWVKSWLNHYWCCFDHVEWQVQSGMHRIYAGTCSIRWKVLCTIWLRGIPQILPLRMQLAKLVVSQSQSR